MRACRARPGRTCRGIGGDDHDRRRHPAGGQFRHDDGQLRRPPVRERARGRRDRGLRDAERVRHRPADYTASTGTATIAEGTNTAVIPVQIVGDTLSEGNETFTVKLSNPSAGNTIGDDTATGTIVDDDPVPSLRVNDVSVAEGNTGSRNATFTVTQSSVAGRDVTVHYATSDNSAKAPADYTPVSGTLTIPAGSTSRTVTVPVRGDTIDENNETFNLNLSGASGASIADSRGVGTIRDDDAAPGMTVSDGRVREGNRGLTPMAFVVRLSQASGKTITVRYATERRSAIPGSDYAGASGTLTIPAGTTAKAVVVNIIGDRARRGRRELQPQALERDATRRCATRPRWARSSTTTCRPGSAATASRPRCSGPLPAAAV